jgi:hypothetical protein
MHVGDTVAIHVRALNRSGDSILGAPIFLASLNPDTLGVDTAKTAVIGRLKGVGRFVAKSGTLPSPIFPITIR